MRYVRLVVYAGMAACGLAFFGALTPLGVVLLAIAFAAWWMTEGEAR